MKEILESALIGLLVSGPLFVVGLCGASLSGKTSGESLFVGGLVAAIGFLLAGSASYMRDHL